MPTPTHSYLKHDLAVLGALAIVIAAAIAALWYFEARDGLFSALAEQYLSLP